MVEGDELAQRFGTDREDVAASRLDVGGSRFDDQIEVVFAVVSRTFLRLKTAVEDAPRTGLQERCDEGGRPPAVTLLIVRLGRLDRRCELHAADISRLDASLKQNLQPGGAPPDEEAVDRLGRLADDRLFEDRKARRIAQRPQPHDREEIAVFAP